MKPMPFSLKSIPLDLPTGLLALAVLALMAQGVVYHQITEEPFVDPIWLGSLVLVAGMIILYKALVVLTQDRLAAAITCFAPSLVPAFVFEGLPVPFVLLIAAFVLRIIARTEHRAVELALLGGMVALAVVFGHPTLQPGASKQDLMMPLLVLFPLCLLGLAAGWRQLVPALSACLSLGLVGARIYGVPIHLAPVTVLACAAAVPAVVYALRDIPKKQSFLMWMVLPTVMYSLFWVAMLPIRPHLHPFTLTSWGS